MSIAIVPAPCCVITSLPELLRVGSGDPHAYGLGRLQSAIPEISLRSSLSIYGHHDDQLIHGPN